MIEKVVVGRGSTPYTYIEMYPYEPAVVRGLKVIPHWLMLYAAHTKMRISIVSSSVLPAR